MKSQEIAEAILEKPSFIKTVTIAPALGRWARLLVSLRIKKRPASETKDLYVSPAKLDTVYEISGLVGRINEITIETPDQHRLTHLITPILVRILATAIANDGTNVPKWLFSVIQSQFTNAELNAAAKEVYRRLDYENFYESIISLNAANMIDIPETPAPGQP